MRKLMLVGLISASVLATGCATGKFTGNAYTGAQARQAQVVKFGKVVSVKDVNIQANNSGVGGAAGGLGGAVAGSNFGAGRGALGAVIAGAVIGGIVGHLADDAVNRLSGQEITIKLADGGLIAVAQEIDAKEGAFRVGDDVRVLTSPFGTTRVVR